MNEALFKNNITKKKYMLLILGVLLMLVIIPQQSYASAGDWIVEKFAALIMSLGESIESMLTDMKCNIDNIVFNKDRTNQGLTLLSNDASSNYVFGVYKSIQYIGAAFLVPLGIVITFDFLKAGDSVQHKAQLKRKLKLFAFSILLLTSMPYFLDIPIAINKAFVEISNSFGLDMFKDINLNGGFLVGIFQKTAKDKPTVMNAIIYDISAFLNLFFVFHYFIRDLTIIFLFLIFPLVVFSFSINQTLTINWAKEMCSNIFTQAIHAFILAIVFGLYASLKDVSSSLYQQLFCLTAFASVIPLTSVIKQMLGLQGNIGAAKAGAGLGGLMGAAMVAKGAFNATKKNVSNIKEGISEYKDAKAKENIADKGNYADIQGSNMKATTGGYGYKNENPSYRVTTGGTLGDYKVSASMKPSGGVEGAKSVMMADIEGQKRRGLKKAIGGAVGIGLGAKYGLGAMAGGLAFGVKGSALSGSIGNAVGNSMGNLGGQAAFGMGARSYDAYNEIYSQDSEPTNEELGISNDVIDGTEYQEQEREARLKQLKYLRQGNPDKAFRAYAKYTPNRVNRQRLDELNDIGDFSNVHMYQDREMAVLFEQGENAEDKTVLWTGEGNPTLTTPTIQGIANQDGEVVVPIEGRERIHATAKYNVISNFGSYDNNNDKHKEFFNNEVQRMVQEVSDRSTQLRNETGINNIILTGEMKPYKPLPTVPPNLSHQLNEAIAERERLKEMKNTIHNSSSDIEVDINSMI